MQTIIVVILVLVILGFIVQMANAMPTATPRTRAGAYLVAIVVAVFLLLWVLGYGPHDLRYSHFP